MKKILALILVMAMVMSLGAVTFSAQENTSVEETSTNDEATFDEASGEKFSAMVFDYILTLTKGDNPFESMNRPYLDGVKISHEYELLYLSTADKEAPFAIIDINFPENDFEKVNHSVKVGNGIITNEVHNLVAPFIGMGYFVVLPEENKVVSLRDALRMNIDNLKEVCLEKGIMRLSGDADGDCKITIKDATYIQKITAGFEGYVTEEFYSFYNSSTFADFNGDRAVNVKDATNIQKYLAGLTFDFMGHKGVSFTEIPENAQPLNIEVVTDKHECFYNGLTAELITSAEEYSSVTGEASEVYDEAFFEEKNLIYIKKGYGSGSESLEILGAYMWEQDTIFIDSCFMTVPPGGAAVENIVCYRAYIAVDKFATENVENIVVYEDVDFHTNRVYY